MSDFNGYNMPDKGLFGKRCIIPYGMSAQPFVYRIVKSGIKSNYWSEVPITAKTVANPVNHGEETEDVIIVVCDTLIDETSSLIRVALKDVEIMND